MGTTAIEKLVDITAGKHGGVSTSQAAHVRTLPHKEQQREEVFQLIAQGPKTMKEVAELMGKPLNCVSGRGSELLKFGRIEPTGETRNGARVLRVSK